MSVPWRHLGMPIYNAPTSASALPVRSLDACGQAEAGAKGKLPAFARPVAPLQTATGNPAPPARPRSLRWPSSINLYVARLPQVVLFGTHYTLRLVFQLTRRLLTRRGPSVGSLCGEALALFLESLGGGFLKVGQLLSTRVDLLPEAVLLPLRRLQDTVSPLPSPWVRLVLSRSLGAPLEELFEQFQPEPLASASVAQVHRATLRGTRAEVAVKVRRPGIERLVAADCRILRCGTWLLSLLPLFRHLPLREAVADVCAVLLTQTDFVREAAALRRYRAERSRAGEISVPGLIGHLCTPEVITMEYVESRGKITEPSVDIRTRRAAARRALQAIYQSIFIDGFFHCDPHPGNLLIAKDGAVVFLDLGCAAELRPGDRRAFAQFFLSIALGNGPRASRIVLETARRVPPGIRRDRFETDITDLIRSCSGQLVAKFQIVRFVTQLFRIQQHHGIHGSPEFTLAILTLLAFEGTLKAIDPDLDFQREAVPSLLIGLAR